MNIMSISHIRIMGMLQIESFVLDSNTWNHLAVYKKCYLQNRFTTHVYVLRGFGIK